MLLHSHGAYVAAGTGPDSHRMLVPQFSYSVTLLHVDVRIASLLNWLTDDLPAEGRPPPLGLSWVEHVDVHLQWHRRNTGIWHATDSRWREAHRVRLTALGASMGSVNVSVLDLGASFDDLFCRGVGFREQGLGGEGPDKLDLDNHDGVEEENARGMVKKIETNVRMDFHTSAIRPHPNGQRPRSGRTPVGAPLPISHAHIVPALLDIAFAGLPINCEPTQCAVLEEMFEWQKLGHYPNAVLDKYVIDVDGNGWSLLQAPDEFGLLIFKATTYPEWYAPGSHPKLLILAPRSPHSRPQRRSSRRASAGLHLPWRLRMRTHPLMCTADFRTRTQTSSSTQIWPPRAPPHAGGTADRLAVRPRLGALSLSHTLHSALAASTQAVTSMVTVYVHAYANLSSGYSTAAAAACPAVGGQQTPTNVPPPPQTYAHEDRLAFSWQQASVEEQEEGEEQE
ncbi:hypothetical protein DFH08DRAFT_1013813 [Mycena albidolilacea]|uniref:Uncharacterized protein n=1 Tax=Mycena albidolilacea TaxID=1033008 RepID=A0AAD7EML7_9AGAR|nr:hypothetical protein DFH08DRAFT_1013813 [Mycena albidolilacea]